MNQPKKILNDAKGRAEWNKTCAVRDYVIDPNTLSIMRRIIPDEKFSEYKNCNEEVIFFNTPTGSTASIKREEAKLILEASYGIEATQFNKHRTLKIGPKDFSRTIKLNSQGMTYQSKTGPLIHIISTSFRSGHPVMTNVGGWGVPNNVNNSWSRLRVALGKFINSEPMGETIPLIESNIMIYPLLNRTAGTQFPIIVTVELRPFKSSSTAIKIYGGAPGEGIRITPAQTGEGELKDFEMSSTVKLWCDAINDVSANPDNAPYILRTEKGPLSKRMEYIGVSGWYSSALKGMGLRIIMNGDYGPRSTKWSFIRDEEFINKFTKVLTDAGSAIDALPGRHELPQEDLGWDTF